MTIYGNQLQNVSVAQVTAVDLRVAIFWRGVGGEKNVKRKLQCKNATSESIMKFDTITY